MPHNPFDFDHLPEPSDDFFDQEDDAALNTERWTSDAYSVRFAAVERVQSDPEEARAFSLSAWGVSVGLRNLLGDYEDTEVHSAAQWLAIRQNQVVADVLDTIVTDTYQAGSSTVPLQNLFVAIDTELFLPRGLKMTVCCVTNIVPRSETDERIDKFVAVLDPGEAQSYIDERTAPYTTYFSSFVH